MCAKPGNMTPGTDGKTEDEMSIDRINKLIESIKDETYSPNPNFLLKKYLLSDHSGRTRINLRGFDVCMSHQRLDGIYVNTIFQQ
jgi:hypothetical protein